MRIIAGTKRGIKLLSPKSDVSRPILDRVKESLFSVLYKYNLPENKRIADVFCGVGSLGIEALSRGAGFVTFVEKDPKIINILNKNLTKTDFVNESKVVRADAFRIGAAVNFANEKYDAIFVDPPYKLSEDAGEKSALAKLLNLLAAQLTADGIVIVRTQKYTELLENYGSLRTIERRQWGSMVVTILRLHK